MDAAMNAVMDERATVIVEVWSSSLPKTSPAT
jgi:hypothetical protein